MAVSISLEQKKNLPQGRFFFYYEYIFIIQEWRECFEASERWEEIEMVRIPEGDYRIHSTLTSSHLYERLV
ncbi:hypothetical protein GCM10010913_26540 [Paenibacillus aceti]|uniref:Uncharacterized protein n=1 Tax=Paenibacillus aceti TaxID=1820010 RepID=A0ABQ1VX82_9BACL|nr:hypothetical protein GCM10010913_26540 [Paenibacillus aceti]